MPDNSPDLDAAAVACQLAAALDAQQHEFALGGAIALGYWGVPRGTIDVDLTLYLAPDKPSECILLLQQLGCSLRTTEALASLREHGFCSATFQRVRVDVFLPTIPFYTLARQRRRRVQLGEQSIVIWDAESLVVFKMMFFRRKDIADVEQILRIQAGALDRDWIQHQLQELYGVRAPRLLQWDELTRGIRPAP